MIVEEARGLLRSYVILEFYQVLDVEPAEFKEAVRVVLAALEHLEYEVEKWREAYQFAGNRLDDIQRVLDDQPSAASASADDPYGTGGRDDAG